MHTEQRSAISDQTHCAQGCFSQSAGFAAEAKRAMKQKPGQPLALGFTYSDARARQCRYEVKLYFALRPACTKKNDGCVLQSVRLRNIPVCAGKVKGWLEQFHFTVQHILIGRCALPQPLMVPWLGKCPLSCQLALPALTNIKKEDDSSLVQSQDWF